MYYLNQMVINDFFTNLMLFYLRKYEIIDLGCQRLSNSSSMYNQQFSSNYVDLNARNLEKLYWKIAYIDGLLRFESNKV